MKSVIAVLTAVFVLASSDIVRAQELLVLQQDKPGAACVAFSQDPSLAYVIDGGSADGLDGARINGESLINVLKARGCSRLAIMCSHPHADHIQGLKQLVQDRSILSLDEIRFVDPGDRKLYDLFTDTHGSNTRTSVSYANGMRDPKPLGGFQSGDVSLEFFRYEADPGAHVHDRCLVINVTLERGAFRTVVVYLDDASESVLRAYMTWVKADPRRSPDVVLASHHGSDEQDVDIVLSDKAEPSARRPRAISAKAVIFAVNAENRYQHPGPQNLTKSIATVGIQNVHFTSMKTVRIVPRGLPPMSDPTDFYRAYLQIVRPQLEKLGPADPRRGVLQSLLLSYSERFTASVYRDVPTRRMNVVALEQVRPSSLGPQVGTSREARPRRSRGDGGASLFDLGQRGALSWSNDDTSRLGLGLQTPERTRRTRCTCTVCRCLRCLNCSN